MRTKSCRGECGNSWCCTKIVQYEYLYTSANFKSIHDYNDRVSWWVNMIEWAIARGAVIYIDGDHICMLYDHICKNLDPTKGCKLGANRPVNCKTFPYDKNSYVHDDCKYAKTHVKFSSLKKIKTIKQFLSQLAKYENRKKTK